LKLSFFRFSTVQSVKATVASPFLLAFPTAVCYNVLKQDGKMPPAQAERKQLTEQGASRDGNAENRRV